jgi:hypothetical protein
MGVFDLFHVDTHATPWFIRLFVCTSATLEHALLLTGVVASRKKDISVKERMGKGNNAIIYTTHDKKITSRYIK